VQQTFIAIDVRPENDALLYDVREKEFVVQAAGTIVAIDLGVLLKGLRSAADLFGAVEGVT